MLRAVSIFVFILLGCVLPGGSSVAHAQQAASGSDPVLPARPVTIDGIAVHIEDDIITDSEVNELAAFQQLVDGHAKAREELIRELIDQWIVRQEATAISYGKPSTDDVDLAYRQLVKQFPSEKEFQQRCAALGLTEAAVRGMLSQQLYLARFIDRRFRPEAQVTSAEVEAYYNDEFTPQLKARNETVPPLDEVDDTIREVLIQRAINQLAEKWLDETRERLKIDVVQQGAGS
jgi:hypothetical protein